MKTFTQKFKETKYRLGMKKALQNASIEELKIALDEVKKEINRRNEQK